MADPVDELRAVAARLKRDIDELTRKIEALPRSDIGDAKHTEEQMQEIVSRALELYQARSPRPLHVTITQAAKMLSLSSRTVSNMLKAGELRFNRCGRIPIEQIDMVLARPRKTRA